ncbi:hypothetical protein C2S52_013425 [Perilla frutescens var. hirtella]|nr:hypothetical protein C2S52_013425 [Perilla frutescens var. hirtella]
MPLFVSDEEFRPTPRSCRRRRTSSWIVQSNRAGEGDACIRQLESEFGRLRAASDRLVQPLILKSHNSWLNEELTTKVNNLIQVQKEYGKEYGEYEADMSSKLEDVTKLLDSYKESSEEWSKKARELEGVNKALETHLNQVESEYKDKLEKEVSARKWKRFVDKLQSSRTELENLKRGNELQHRPPSSLQLAWEHARENMQGNMQEGLVKYREALGPEED